MARPLRVVRAEPVTAVAAELTNALAGSGTICVLPDAPPPTGDWYSTLHLREPVPDDIAALIATSGSTGAPRAVMLTAGAMLACAHAAMRRLDGPGAWVLALPVSSVGGLQVLVRSAMTGLDPVCLDRSAGFQAADFALATQSLPSGYPHYTSLVPTQLRRIIDAGGAALDALAGFDAVLIGGAALETTLREAAESAGVRIVSTYGMTETSGGCVYEGIPLEGVHVRSSPAGLQIGGDTIARGYHGEPKSTEQSFVDNWFLTRDVGLVDATGLVSVTGRTDDIIISGGVNVSTDAVAAALLARPDILDAVVLGRDDPEWGQAVIAVVATVADAPLDVSAVRADVATRLGAAAAPREVITVAALPYLHTGKVDRAAAQRLAASSAGRQVR